MDHSENKLNVYYVIIVIFLNATSVILCKSYYSLHFSGHNIFCSIGSSILLKKEEQRNFMFYNIYVDTKVFTGNREYILCFKHTKHLSYRSAL